MKNLVSDLLPAHARLQRAFWIALALWIFFFVVTAYATANTLMQRIDATDAMQAARGGIWQGRIALQIAEFTFMQALLHLFFATLTWLLACASAILYDKLRHKIGRLVVGWFSLLAAAALAFNALWYPRTLIGAYYNFAMQARLGPWYVGQWVYVGVFILAVVILLSAGAVIMRNVSATTRRRSLLVAGSGAALIGAVLLLPSALWKGATAATAGRPNIIILGIDSLRLEQLKRFGGSDAAPNLDRFLASADVFTDTTTPVARTYPSWSSILTSRSPNITGARFNLANRSEVTINPTIGDVLRRYGYQTVYSTDEVRFANIDETYGFDQVVTPRIGASDFIIGSYNEFPLASLVINTPIARWMFPFSYGNRGVATMFHPETFVGRIRREVSFDRPTLFISHLTAAHWPYFTGDVPFGVPISTPDDPHSMYRTGLRTADRMFGEILQVLESKGALKNALVIVLSDHGEAFGMPSDSFFEQTFQVDGLRAPLQVLDRGHGQSVLSKSQYHLLLSFRTFGTPSNLGKGRDLAFPATAEDVSPTILEYLGIRGDPLSTTGTSLLGYMDGRKAVGTDDEKRIRFTETDLAVLPAPGGRVDEEGTARKNALFFEVDPKSGRLQMRHRLTPIARGYKERAAFTRDMLLAAIPAGPYASQYLLLDFKKNHGQLLLARPQADAAEAQRLWDALEAHYRGELRTPVAVTPEDWPRINREWKYYTADRTGMTSGPYDSDSSVVN